MVSALILLRDALRLLPGLGQALAPASGSLLTAVRSTVQHAAFPQLLELLETAIDQVRSCQGSTHATDTHKPSTST